LVHVAAKPGASDADHIAFLQDRRILLEFLHALLSAFGRPTLNSKFSVNGRFTRAASGDARISAAVHQLEAQRAVDLKRAIECAPRGRAYAAASQRDRCSYGHDCEPREFVSFCHFFRHRK
jgi:hypothetical protein